MRPYLLRKNINYPNHSCFYLLAAIFSKLADTRSGTATSYTRYSCLVQIGLTLTNSDLKQAARIQILFPIFICPEQFYNLENSHTIFTIPKLAGRKAQISIFN